MLALPEAPKPPKSPRSSRAMRRPSPAELGPAQARRHFSNRWPALADCAAAACNQPVQSHDRAFAEMPALKLLFSQQAATRTAESWAMPRHLMEQGSDVESSPRARHGGAAGSSVGGGSNGDAGGTGESGGRVNGCSSCESGIVDRGSSGSGGGGGDGGRGRSIGDGSGGSGGHGDGISGGGSGGGHCGSGSCDGGGSILPRLVHDPLPPPPPPPLPLDPPPYMSESAPWPPRTGSPRTGSSRPDSPQSTAAAMGATLPLVSPRPGCIANLPDAGTRGVTATARPQVSLLRSRFKKAAVTLADGEGRHADLAKTAIKTLSRARAAIRDGIDDDFSRFLAGDSMGMKLDPKNAKTGDQKAAAARSEYDTMQRAMGMGAAASAELANMMGNQINERGDAAGLSGSQHRERAGWLLHASSICVHTRGCVARVAAG